MASGVFSLPTPVPSSRPTRFAFGHVDELICFVHGARAVRREIDGKRFWGNDNERNCLHVC